MAGVESRPVQDEREHLTAQTFDDPPDFIICRGDATNA